jgi:hypothetical protein
MADSKDYDIKEYKRDGSFVLLQPFDLFAGADDFMEVTHWYNGEGFDVQLSTKAGEQRMSFTWGEYQALTTLVPPDNGDDD